MCLIDIIVEKRGRKLKRTHSVLSRRTIYQSLGKCKGHKDISNSQRSENEPNKVNENFNEIGVRQNGREVGIQNKNDGIQEKSAFYLTKEVFCK